MESVRLSRILPWAALLVWAAVLLWMEGGKTRPPTGGPGALDGRFVDLTPHDSAVAILVTTAECNGGRMGVPLFRSLAPELQRSGIAFRAVIKSRPQPARSYARLLQHPGGAIRDRYGRSLGRLDSRVVPSLYVLDSHGTLVASFVPVPAVEQAPGTLAATIRRSVRR